MIDLDRTNILKTLAAAPDATLVLDRKGGIVLANDRLYDILGYTPDELTGQPVEKLLPERLRAALAFRLRRLVRQPRSRPMRSGLELAGLHKDGQEVPLEVALRPFDIGAERVAICAIRNVASRKVAEESFRRSIVRLEDALAARDAQIRQSEEHLRLFVEHAPAAVAMLDLDMRYLLVSERWLEDYDLGDRNVIGLCHYDIFPNLPETWKAAHRQCLQGQVLRSEEDVFIGPTGKQEFLRWELRPWRDSTGAIGGLFLFTEVITRRKLAELALRESHERLERDVADRTRALEAARDEAMRASAAKSRFLTAVSHDLRQPMQSVAMLEGLLGRRLHDRDSRAILGRIQDSIGHMVDMVEALLDIGQLESGEIKPQCSEFPVLAMLARKAAEYAPVAAAKGLDLRIVPCSVAIRSDSLWLERIIGNMLSNAVKYTERGRILLGCRRRGSALRIEVWDTGIGIAEDQRTAIFEQFYWNGAGGRQSGLGLGLYFIRQACALLGHHIDLRSSVDKGTLIAVEVPIVGSHQAGTAVRQRPAAPTILLVEDDSILLQEMASLLNAQGYEVVAVASAMSALAAISGPNGAQPHLVICDYDLGPGMTGLDLIRMIRADWQAAVPAVIFSGDNSIATVRKIEAGGVGHLVKPAKANDLLAAIRSLIGSADVTQPSGTAPLISPAEPRAGSPMDCEVGVIEDDPHVREAIKLMLEAEGCRVTAYGSAEAFFADAHHGRFRCLILDVTLPGLGGVEIQARLRSEATAIPTIFMTGQADLPTAVSAVKAGAIDFLRKPVRAEELLDSVKRAIAMHPASNGDVQAKSAEARLAALTTRERQILEGMLNGMSTKVIAAGLGISDRTTEHHRQSIMRKMGVKSLATLVRMVGASIQK